MTTLELNTTVPFLISKVDVSSAIVDPKYYVDRASIIKDLNITDQSQVDIINNFITRGYDLRTLVGLFNGIGFSVYPDKIYYLSNSIDTDSNYDGENEKVNTIYSVLVGMTVEYWKVITDLDIYTKFKESVEEIKPVLGWNIFDYKLAPSIPGLTLNNINYELIDVFWNNAVEIK